jgi:hypothetical protein
MEALAGVATMSLGAHAQADVDGVGSRTAAGAAVVVTRDVRSMPPQEHAATPAVGGAATVNVLGVSAHAHAVTTEVGGAASTDEQTAVAEGGDAASTDARDVSAQAHADVEMQDAVPTDELGVSAHARADTTEVRDSVPMYESSEGRLEMMARADTTEVRDSVPMDESSEGRLEMMVRADTTEVRDSVPMDESSEGRLEMMARADTTEVRDSVPMDASSEGQLEMMSRADTTEVRDSVPMDESSEGQLEMMVSAEVEVSMSVEDKWGVARDGVVVAATVADTVLAAVQFGVHAGFTVGRFLATGTARVATAGAVMVVAMNAAGDDGVSDAGEHVLLTLARVTRVSMTAHATYVLRT